jgi:hypothetical protein
MKLIKAGRRKMVTRGWESKYWERLVKGYKISIRQEE